MRYAIIDGTAVTNVIVAKEGFAASIGAVLIPEGLPVQQGDRYEDGEFVLEPRPEPPETPEPGLTAQDILDIMLGVQDNG